VTFIVRLVDEKGIESCGFHLPNQEMMEEYVASVMAHVSFYVQRIMVYESEYEPRTLIVGATSFHVSADRMRLFKEIYVGHRPKEKSRHSLPTCGV